MGYPAAYRIDHRDSMQSESNHDSNIAAWARVKRPRDPEQDRFELLRRFGAESEKRREALFDQLHPFHHHSRLLHPNPLEAREVGIAALAIRRIGWRGAQWQASIRALDMTQKLHWRWVWSMYYYDAEEDPRMWELNAPHRVPEGIPIGTPSAADKQDWNPETTLWLIEDAAMHELEIHMGGAASMLLHDALTVGKAERTKARNLVGTYLAYWRFHKDKLPINPYGAEHWGHDARIKTLTLHDPFAVEDIRFTSPFDPETFEYTVRRPIKGSTVRVVEFFDPFMSKDNNLEVTEDAEGVEHKYKVTAQDGTTEREYIVRVSL